MQTRTIDSLANFLASLKIWIASSLVGDKTSAVGLIWLSSRLQSMLLLRMLCKIGRRKAAVLPDPVWAQAIKSRPLIITGIVCFWTGVGVVYLAFAMLSNSSFRKLASENDSIFLWIFGVSSVLDTWNQNSFKIEVVLNLKRLQNLSSEGNDVA